MWPAFAAAASVAALIILWLGSGVGYSLDEIDTLIRTPGLDFDGTLEPHNGHFIFTTRVAYWAILELFGTDYLAFRLLTVATVVLTAGLFLAYAGRRIGKLSALALALLLLFFGSHPSHVMNGNGFTVLFAIACGLAALLLLERNDRGGDIGACVLLCLGVATYTTGLPFVAGAAVAILLRDERWRRIWVVVVPVAIYFAWWLQAEGQIGDPQDQATVSNLLLLPAWGFQILSGVLGSVTGFDYFGELASAGPALAVAALGVLAWRLARGRVPDSFWTALAVVLAIWALGRSPPASSGSRRLPLLLLDPDRGAARRRHSGSRSAVVADLDHRPLRRRGGCAEHEPAHAARRRRRPQRPATPDAFGTRRSRRRRRSRRPRPGHQGGDRRRPARHSRSRSPRCPARPRSTPIAASPTATGRSGTRSRS